MGLGPIPNLGPMSPNSGLFPYSPAEAVPVQMPNTVDCGPAGVLTPGPKIFPFLPAPIGPATCCLPCTFCMASSPSANAPSQQTPLHHANGPCPITRYPHDRMPNCISYSDSARVIRTSYSDSARVIRPLYSDSAMMIRPSCSDSAMVIRPPYLDSAMMIRPW